LSFFVTGSKGKQYGHLAITLKGEVVRSESERVLADYFSRSGTKYVYEQPAMGRWGFRRISRPDFYLPDYGVYVEYWGLVNLPNSSARSRYERNMRWKMAQYLRNGIRYVSLYPSELGYLDTAFGPKLEQAIRRSSSQRGTEAFCARCGQPMTPRGGFCTGCTPGECTRL
jgi:hypothetical protein